MSEPLFNAICLLALYLGCRLRLDRPSTAACLGIVCGLATLTRYAGAFTVPFVAMIMFLHRGKALGDGIRQVAWFGFSFLSTIAPWFLWLRAQDLGPRQISHHAVDWEPLVKYFAEHVSAWLAPPQAPLLLRTIAVGALLGFMLPRLSWRKAEDRYQRLAWGSIGGLVVYLTFILISIVSADPGVGFTQRTLSPVALLLAVFLCCSLPSAFGPSRRQWVAVLILSGSMLFSVHRTYSLYVAPVYRGQAGYQGKAWRTSETIGWLRGLPVGTTIYSNDAGGIVTWLPVRAKWVGNRELPAKLLALREAVRQSAPAVFVMFKGKHAGSYQREVTAAFDVDQARSFEFPDSRVFAFGLEDPADGRPGS
jgi:4-amino-4-deoxy-L-arabinose transferase-like glycosyltransferase